MSSYSLKFFVLVIAQIIAGAVLDFTPMLSLCILPALVLALPTRYGGAVSMLIAFVLGLAVDFLCSAQLGLSSCALVVVAAGRRVLIDIVFGAETLERSIDISIQKQSLRKILTATIIATGVYFALLLALESAGTLAWWTLALKWLYSVALSSLCSLLASSILYSDSSPRWK